MTANNKPTLRSRSFEQEQEPRANGTRSGRKPKLTPGQRREALARLAQGETQRTVARSYNDSQATIWRLKE